MKVYLLVEAPMYDPEICIVDVCATHEDAEIRLKEVTSKRHGWLSMNPDDYFIDERELKTYKTEYNYCTDRRDYGTKTD